MAPKRFTYRSQHFALTMPQFEAQYPLSPMQEGMLFHALYAPESDIYFGQAHWSLYGPLDVGVFHSAWQSVVDRHPILRTSFDWARSGRPLQRVHRDAVVPLELIDWRARSQAERDRCFREFLRSDRERGFTLQTAPILRITVIRMEDEQHHVVWSTHHVLVDGRSVNLIVREVLECYNNHLDGAGKCLPKGTPYSEFVGWVGKQDTLAAERFWREFLHGFTTPTSFRRTPLGTDETQRAIATQHCEIRLSRPELHALHALARSSDVTLNVVLTTAWAILCSRYSRSSDVVFGIPVGSGGRGAPRHPSLTGLLINTLPLRVAFSPDCPTRVLLQRVKLDLKVVSDHAYSSLVDIAAWSDVPPALPLFDNIVVFDNASLHRLSRQHGRLHVGPLSFEQYSNYPLNLIVQRGDRLVLKATYSERDFDAETIRRLLDHLRNLLRSMAQNPDDAVSSLQYAEPEEPHRDRGDWNTPRIESDEKTLLAAFAEIVRRFPENVAASQGGVDLTYAQLDERANRFARVLEERGVGPEVVVALALERSIELIVSIVAVAKTGGAFLCIDVDGPVERNAWIVADAGVAVVVSRRALAVVLPTVERVFLDDDIAREYPTTGPPEAGSPHSLAYVIYTSGTTGEPKGIAVEWCSLTNLACWHADAFGISARDRVSQIASPIFDAMVWEIWPNLSRGACICIPPDDIRASPAQLQSWLVSQRVTVAFVPTPLTETLLALQWPAETSLRTLLTGGDVLHTRPGRFLPFALVNNYGPSECTVVATSGVISPDDDGHHLPSIGQPIAGVEIYLLDADGHPVPAGVPGEIFIGGQGVARGYINRPDITAERFIQCPIQGQSTRLYRTGDLARRAPDGSIHFMGRLDGQIQLRGYRIEPGEIEAVLCRHPGVAEAVVVVRELDAREMLIAYVVAARGTDLHTQTIRRFLQAKLPRYMIPTCFVAVEHLPITANGKIDRARLPAPLLSSQTIFPEQAAAVSSLEQAIVEIWKSTLHLDAVGCDDNFFDLGGNSLLAIELLETIRLHVHRDLSLPGFFAAPTVRGLARLCEEPPTTSSTGILVPIQPVGSRPPFFCAAPVLGTVFPYYDLAYLMKPDQPFYGLQPLGIADRNATSWAIESIARQYVRAIRQVQPEGPYHIGGWSFGGLVAFEMARQLVEEGEIVPLLLVLDTPAPGLHLRMRPSQTVRVVGETLLGGAWGYLCDYEYLAAESGGRTPQRSMWSRFGRRLAVGRGLLRASLRRASIARIVPAKSRLLAYHVPTIREMLWLCRRGIVSTLRYRPQIYDG